MSGWIEGWMMEEKRKGREGGREEKREEGRRKAGQHFDLLRLVTGISKADPASC